MRTVAAFMLVLAAAMPAAAQSSDEAISIRPFAMVDGEQFAAKKTFDAVFGQSSQFLFGAGLEFVEARGWYLDLAASRFKKTGERAFVSNGTTFHLGIPVTSTLIPLEVTAGYRFRVGRSDRLRPYAGAGLGSYGYKETSPASVSDSTDDVDVRHFGFLVVGGVECRVQKWASIAADVQYTSISGILGTGGVSGQVKETDLGGVAARVRVILGRSPRESVKRPPPPPPRPTRNVQ